VKIVLATRNAGKLHEYRRMFDQLGTEIESLDRAEVDPGLELPEDGDTFVANALSKTQALHRLIGGWVMGDDSGLEVDALGGAPGVYSARYAGHGGKGSERDRANCGKLLIELNDTPDDKRTARFVCVIVLLGPDGQKLIARGTCEGRIIRAPRGTSGFGYDPVFLPRDHIQTMAELPMDQKNAISHRGRALKKLVEVLRAEKNRRPLAAGNLDGS
jgi:XTP/dITP diphosphohydrolase